MDCQLAIPRCPQISGGIPSGVYGLSFVNIGDELADIFRMLERVTTHYYVAVKKGLDMRSMRNITWDVCCQETHISIHNSTTSRSHTLCWCQILTVGNRPCWMPVFIGRISFDYAAPSNRGKIFEAKRITKFSSFFLIKYDFVYLVVLHQAVWYVYKLWNRETLIMVKVVTESLVYNT